LTGKEHSFDLIFVDGQTLALNGTGRADVTIVQGERVKVAPFRSAVKADESQFRIDFNTGLDRIKQDSSGKRTGNDHK
jgi:hypothetical protein